VLDGVVDALGAALDVDRVYIQLFADEQPAGIERQWHRPGLASLAEVVPALFASPAAEDTTKGLTVCDDVTADPAVSERFVAATGAGALVKTTFGFDEEVFGEVVLVQVDSPRQWLPDEIALVDAVSADLGRAFEHVRLYEHERELVERLREVDEQKTDFIATVSHELRTPLTSVLGYLEVLTSGDQGPIPDRQMRSLRVIERNAERLGEMVADLLTLSRIETGSFNLDVGSVRTSDIVAGALETLGPVAAGVGLQLDTDVPDELWVAGDRSQLQRIIGNLVGNAIKFSVPGGAIRVDAAEEGTDWVRISVSDTGAGIPEQEQRQLFEPFQRGANAVANAAQGPGLGLAVVRSIVEQHHGRVELASEVGLGTKVTVRLPRSAAEIRAEPAPTAAGTA
jgi:signal transduction histidine kinase